MSDETRDRSSSETLEDVMICSTCSSISKLRDAFAQAER